MPCLYRSRAKEWRRTLKVEDEVDVIAHLIEVGSRFHNAKPFGTNILDELAGACLGAPATAKVMGQVATNHEELHAYAASAQTR